MGYRSRHQATGDRDSWDVSDSVVDDLEIDPTAVLLEQRLVAQAVLEMDFWALVSVEGDLEGLDKDSQGWWCLQVPNTQQFHTQPL